MAWYDYMKGFFYKPPNEEKNEDVEELLEVLKSLSEDLQFSSESDYPFEVFTWEMVTDEVNIENLNQYIELEPTADIKLDSIKKILFPMSKSRPYYSAERREKANRFQQIITFFESQLSNTKAFKIGKIERTIYLLGSIGNTHVIGLKTMSVET